MNNNIETTYTFDVGSNPGNLVINQDGTDLYFSNGSIYKMNILDSQLPNNPLINRGFYGLGFNLSLIHI